MSARKVNKIAINLFVISLFFLLLLLLTSFNINYFLKESKSIVLGISTVNNEEIFWKDFLIKNPDYIPGWIELGEKEKVKNIDPNYQ